MTFRWEIKVKGFGPFISSSGGVMEAKCKRHGERVALYSGNGQGKTCLSRMFRAARRECDALVDSDITRGAASGSFEFSVLDHDAGITSPTALRLTKKRGSAPAIEDETGFIFHVFNSDYVKENLEEASYSPSGKIDGYIVGKANIDTSEKKKLLSELQAAGERLRGAVQAETDAAKDELVSLGVSRTTTEFKAITYDNVCQATLGDNSFAEKLNEYNVLRDLPDDLPELQSLHFTPPAIQYEQLSRTLAEQYDRASFADEFLTSISSKIDFVKSGMQLTGEGDVCPFCGQPYDDGARDLLRRYGEYLDGQEASIVAGIKAYKSALKALHRDYIDLVRRHVSVTKEFDRRKLGFSEYKSTSISELPSIDSFDAAINQVLALLDEKCCDISSTLDSSAVTSLK